MKFFDSLERPGKKRLVRISLVAAGVIVLGGASFLLARGHQAEAREGQDPAARIRIPSGITVRPAAPSASQPGIPPVAGAAQPAVTGPGAAPQNCTYPIRYWSENQVAWLADNVAIGRLSFDRSDITSLLAEQEAARPATALAAQFMAAILNSMQGADSAGIQETLEGAGVWLEQHFYQNVITPQEKLAAAELQAALASFNLGESGPGLCREAVAYLPPTPTATPFPTPTSIPAPALAYSLLNNSSEDNTSARNEREEAEESQAAVAALATSAPTAQPTLLPAAPQNPSPDDGKDGSGDGGQNHGRDRDKHERKDRRGQEKEGRKDHDREYKQREDKDRDDEDRDNEHGEDREEQARGKKDQKDRRNPKGQERKRSEP